ncbi:MAG: extracellular solute-binding protein, partial [Brachybacterium sp.]
MKRRKFTTLLTASALGAAAMPALSACGGSGGGSGDGTSLVIWHYENEDSAMGQAWALAQEIFEEAHPEVTVTVEKQTFEQLQKNATIVLTGDDVPDLMEFNKGNSTAGQLAAQALIEP